ncbi:MAG: RecQ family ATP-dependent DNA helicase [Fusobacteriaceae bacterium]
MDACLKGEKILLVAATGYGKSLCFQYPALLFDGVTLVVTPLISLMRNQVNKLRERNIPAESINCEKSDISKETEDINRKILENVKNGKIKILYISPERISNNIFQKYLTDINISMVVIDEAHCISEWGHDFRPDYQKIVEVLKRIPKKIPVLSLTATADEKIAQDICRQMKINQSETIKFVRQSLYRKNLKLLAIKVDSDEEKMNGIYKFISKNKKELVGIIYCRTKINVEKYVQWLHYKGIKATAYHSKIQNREEIEEKFMNEEIKCIVATCAFGMGIDKANVRYVIHTEIPGSIITYYQEIGRAGRDGKGSDVLLFYKTSDEKIQQNFIESSRPKISKYNKVIKELKCEPFKMKLGINKCDIRETQMRTILNDLINQKIIRKNKGIYEYIPNAPELKIDIFNSLKKDKYKRVEDIKSYINSTDCRMLYITNYLDDYSNNEKCKNCDNDKNWNDKIKESIILSESDNQDFTKFYEKYLHPILEIKSKSEKIFNGISVSYYGDTKIGKEIHNSKYEKAGPFSNYILQQSEKIFKQHFKDEKFDLAIYIPPTKSGDLVKDFSKKLCERLSIPLSHKLKKRSQTNEQKNFETTSRKKENVQNIFYFENPEELKEKKILIIDDVWDSGETIKEVAKYLSSLNINFCIPFTIAKTVGGEF